MAAQISERDKSAIMDAAIKLYYVSSDEKGSYIELHADYHDFNDFLLPVAYEHRDDERHQPSASVPANNILHSLQDAIGDAWDETIWMTEDEILREAGFDPNDDRCEPQKEWLRENLPIVPPYDHFLDQSIRVNILLCTPSEPNHCFADIHDQYIAMSEPDRLTDGSLEAVQELLSMDTSLKRLVEQQGYTISQLADTMKDYNAFFYASPQDNAIPLSTQMEFFNKTHSKFLTSVCQELENHRYSMGNITVLANVSLHEFADMMKSDSKITMPTDTMCGIFSPDNGAGSVLEIALEKPLVFSNKDIYDIQIEGVKPDYGYLLDSVYGLVHSCWKGPKSIEIAPERANQETLEETITSSLDSLLSSAAARAASQSPGHIQPSLEAER